MQDSALQKPVETNFHLAELWLMYLNKFRFAVVEKLYPANGPTTIFALVRFNPVSVNEFALED
jgi:hypothetical protein